MAIDFIKKDDRFGKIFLLGASTGAAAALIAAFHRPMDIAAIVSRGGRPDLVSFDTLASIRIPTLLIVGAKDEWVLQQNKEVLNWLGSSKKMLELIPGASHLFEEPGT
jgi:pimeloyl-ACP methyl ester carboxylesterase